MPTTITSAGITFNDATSLTSAVIPANAIGATQIANGAVTAAKLGTNEQRQIAKAWVNFSGLSDVLSNLENAGTLTPVNGGNTVNWYSPTGIWTASSFIGIIYNILNIGGSTSGTLGGIPCSQLYLQLQSITNVNNAVFKLVNANGTNTATTFTSSAIVTGNGTSSGMQYTRTGIRSSYNVSSVTKNGTGDYTINFTTPMADANYCVSGSGSLDSGGAGNYGFNVNKTFNGSTTGSTRIVATYAIGTQLSDGAYINAIIIGN